MTLRTRSLLAAALLSPALALASEDPLAFVTAPAEHGKAATADASPVDPGAMEVEFGYLPVWNNRGGSAGFHRAEDGHTHGFSATLTYGAAPDVDVKVAFAAASVYDAAPALEDSGAPTRGAGMADMTLGARWRFLTLEEQALELAFTADAVLPTGAPGTGEELGLTQDFWSARGALVATKDFGPLTLNGEVAFGVPVSGDAGGLRSIGQVNAAVGYQLKPWLQPELELNYQAALGPDSQVLAATAGVVAPFGDGHRIVAAVQQALWGSNTAQTTAAVLSFKTAL